MCCCHLHPEHCIFPHYLISYIKIILLFSYLCLNVCEGGAHTLFIFISPVSSTDHVSNICLINIYWWINTLFGKWIFVLFIWNCPWTYLKLYSLIFNRLFYFNLFSNSRLFSVTDIQRSLSVCWLNSRSSFTLCI